MVDTEAITKLEKKPDDTCHAFSYDALEESDAWKATLGRWASDIAMRSSNKFADIEVYLGTIPLTISKILWITFARIQKKT